MMLRVSIIGAVAAAAVAGVFYTGWNQKVEAPPRDQRDACNIMRERPEWYSAAREAAEKWDVPTPTLLAIIWRESNFRARVRPPRRDGWWIFPGKHISTAYGFSQALDGTWDWYREDVGASRARRDDFRDAVDFVGWYMDKSQRKLGFSAYDPRNHYLAYHQGHGGYRSGRWKRNASLKKAAGQVERMAQRYDGRLFDCDIAHFKAGTLKESPLPQMRPGMIADIPVPTPKPLREVAELSDG